MAGSSPLQKENFKELITPGLKAAFFETLEARKKLAKRYEIFGTDSTTRSTETTASTGALDARNWNFRKHGRVQRAGLERGFPKTWNPIPFAQAIDVDRELVDDLLESNHPIPRDLAQRPVAIADALEIFCENVAAEVFNYAFTDSGTTPNGFSIAGPDGVGLVSTAHPLGPNNSATQSNEFTLELTADNLDTVVTATEDFTDDNGNRIGLDGDRWLIVPKALRRRAEAIVNSELEPGTANNTINTMRDSVSKIITWPALTDPTAWFVVEPVRMKQHLIWLDRVLPDFFSEKDNDTQQYSWGVYCRFDRGYDDWKWIAGSKPA